MSDNNCAWNTVLNPKYILTWYSFVTAKQCYWARLYILSLCSVVVQRHHGDRNYYKWNHLIDVCWQFQRFSLLTSWQGARLHAGNLSAGEVEESFTCASAGSWKRKTLGLPWVFETSKHTLNETLPPKPHIYSNK